MTVPREIVPKQYRLFPTKQKLSISAGAVEMPEPVGRSAGVNAALHQFTQADAPFAGRATDQLEPKPVLDWNDFPAALAHGKRNVSQLLVVAELAASPAGRLVVNMTELVLLAHRICFRSERSRQRLSNYRVFADAPAGSP